MYARTLEGLPKSAWQKLIDHLVGVARRASEFASFFDSRDWGFCSGLWHDLGKYSDRFQAKLEGAPIAVEHSGVGAAFAVSKRRDLGLPLAFVIAGHHTGLADYIGSEDGLPTPLKERLSDNFQLARTLSSAFPACVLDQRIPEIPPFLRAQPTASRVQRVAEDRRLEFWIRFLFSALVDADRLDSEQFCTPESAAERSWNLSIATLSERISAYIASLPTALPVEARDMPVNLVRRGVVNDCQEAASSAQGCFSLTVPTGGGKTLSAMLFALSHALHHSLRRVVVVIPYTSIIEQNAQVYREALGAEAVVEHHSSLDPEATRSSLGEDVANRHELAAENWDAPVIVTTTVQFFESLFSNRPSRCRKLHNVAKSVIILDEVQTLPPAFLNSILDGLNELVHSYGCSVVLATATPPALKQRERFDFGLPNCTEIARDPQELTRSLKRVDYSWPADASRSLDSTQLAAELSEHGQALAIVHRRQDARETAQGLESLVSAESVLHLSALMCPAHRTQTVKAIKRKLKDGEACRVVSTQLVEAGVDVDFPVVYRALGGLDSIVQAAGRCNREGRQKRGKVVVFRAQSAPPQGTPRRALAITESLLKERNNQLDPDDHRLFEDYFRMLYFAEETDPRGIQTMRQQFQFASVARDFKLIEDGFTRSIVVPFGDALDRLREVRQFGPSRDGIRCLQPFTVNIYPDAYQRLIYAKALEEVADGIWALTPPYFHMYDAKYGLVVGDEPAPNADALIV